MAYLYSIYKKTLNAIAKSLKIVILSLKNWTSKTDDCTLFFFKFIFQILTVKNHLYFLNMQEKLHSKELKL